MNAKLADDIRRLLKDRNLQYNNLSLKKNLVSFKRGEIIIQQYGEIKNLYLILKGSAVVQNSIDFATTNIIDHIENPHIIGILEYLDDAVMYTSYVVAEKSCVLYKISLDEFDEIIKNDHDLCYKVLKIMGWMANTSLVRAEILSSFNRIDIVGHNLYLEAKNNIPFIYPKTRQQLADSLHLNLRTLYRYLDNLHRNEYIKLNKGKIVIDEACFIKLEDRYGNISL